MRLTRTGAPNGIYIIYDFYPKDPNGSRPCRCNGGYWGYFDGSGNQFSCAMVADQVSDFHLFRSVYFTEIVRHPIEIVRVVRSPQGSLIRATTAR